MIDSTVSELKKFKSSSGFSPKKSIKTMRKIPEFGK